MSHDFGVGTNFYRPPQGGAAVAHQLTRHFPVPQRPRPPGPFGRGRPGRPRGRPLVGRPIKRPLQPFGMESEPGGAKFSFLNAAL